MRYVVCSSLQFPSLPGVCIRLSHERLDRRASRLQDVIPLRWIRTRVDKLCHQHQGTALHHPPQRYHTPCKTWQLHRPSSVTQSPLLETSTKRLASAFRLHMGAGCTVGKQSLCERLTFPRGLTSKRLGKRYATHGFQRSASPQREVEVLDAYH